MTKYITIEQYNRILKGLDAINYSGDYVFDCVTIETINRLKEIKDYITKN